MDDMLTRSFNALNTIAAWLATQDEPVRWRVMMAFGPEVAHLLEEIEAWHENRSPAQSIPEATS